MRAKLQDARNALSEKTASLRESLLSNPQVVERRNFIRSQLPSRFPRITFAPQLSHRAKFSKPSERFTGTGVDYDSTRRSLAAPDHQSPGLADASFNFADVSCLHYVPPAADESF